MFSGFFCEFAFHFPVLLAVPQRGRHSDLRIGEFSLYLPSLRTTWANMCVCVGGQGKKNRICCLVRANYPDNWLKFFSSVAGIDTVFGQAAGNRYPGGGKHLPPAPQTLGVRIPAKTREPDCSCRDPAWKSERKGKGAEEWKPAPDEGNQEGEHSGLEMGFT